MAAAYLKNWDQIKKVGHACSEDTKFFRGGGVGACILEQNDTYPQTAGNPLKRSIRAL